VIFNGCLDTSSCVNINTLAIPEKSLNNPFKIYPNPTKGDVLIEFEYSHAQIHARITSITGQVIASKTVSNTNRLTFNLETVKGSYFLEITTDKDDRAVVKVLFE
jgi:hypothetical protein